MISAAPHVLDNYGSVFGTSNLSVGKELDKYLPSNNVVLTMHDGTDFIHWAENQRASTVALRCIAEATAAQSG